MSGPSHETAYRIHTKRLVLRCFSPADAPLLKAAVDASLAHLEPWMPWVRGEPQPIEQKIELLRRFRSQFDLGEDFTYAVMAPGESELCGGAGLHARIGPGALEMGYWIHVDHAGTGLGTEVAAALTRVGFEVCKLDRIEIRCDPANTRSAAIPRNLGYRHEATLRRRVPWGDSDFRDSLVWTMFASDYPSSVAARAPVEAFDAIGRKLI